MTDTGEKAFLQAEEKDTALVEPPVEDMKANYSVSKLIGYHPSC